MVLCQTAAVLTAGEWGIPPFFVVRGPHATPPSSGLQFDFTAPTVARNALRTLRALQLRKAVLLEGSPGVGKSSLVAALAKGSGERCLVGPMRVMWTQSLPTSAATVRIDYSADVPAAIRHARSSRPFSKAATCTAHSEHLLKFILPPMIWLCCQSDLLVVVLHCLAALALSSTCQAQSLAVLPRTATSRQLLCAIRRGVCCRAAPELENQCVLWLHGLH